MIGFLSGHRIFELSPYSFMGRFDNGEERQIDSVRVMRQNAPEQTCYLADVEGDVMIFGDKSAVALCPCSAGQKEALSAFRKAVPITWFLVI